MKKVLLTIVTSAWLFTGAMCGSVDLTQLIANAQAEAVKLCSFVPDAATVAAIFAANNPALQSGAAIAIAICESITKAPTASPDGSVTGAVVAGVPVKGHYVTK